jgi:hypothetical protein
VSYIWFQLVQTACRMLLTQRMCRIILAISVP